MAAYIDYRGAKDVENYWKWRRRHQGGLGYRRDVSFSGLGEAPPAGSGRSRGRKIILVIFNCENAYESINFHHFSVGNKCYKSRAIAGRTARYRCKFRYVSNFTAASCGFSVRALLSCIAYISDLSNAEITHIRLRWFSRPWRKITSITENHCTRPKSRQKPRWSWIRDYLRNVTISGHAYAHRLYFWTTTIHNHSCMTVTSSTQVRNASFKVWTYSDVYIGITFIVLYASSPRNPPRISAYLILYF